jgi:hypothetical protein
MLWAAAGTVHDNSLQLRTFTCRDMIQHLGESVAVSRTFRILALVLATCSCAPSEQNLARRAIDGSDFEDCLNDAHWIPAIRRGALTFSPFSGRGFVALDQPWKAANIDDQIFAPEIVGSAKTVANLPLEQMERAYREAGSPSAPVDPAATWLGLGSPLFQRNKGSGYIRGTASGWVSKENNIFCGNDAPGGRFFVIRKFDPAFIVNVR